MVEGYIASFWYRIRASALNGTRRQYGDQPPVPGSLKTDCATGVVAGVDFFGIVPGDEVPALVIQTPTPLATCGREGNATTQRPWSRGKDAVLLPGLSCTSETQPPGDEMAGGRLCLFLEPQTGPFPSVQGRPLGLQWLRAPLLPELRLADNDRSHRRFAGPDTACDATGVFVREVLMLREHSDV